ncbi:hypothetical protein MmTuc01_2642 [Methanosarcina mazei Tuc01]|uniref:Uncharacterized protein n=1 Tax=Methanosarcina mazei Tuc01 TaxID=1236903 RepID=M1Q052_METMZ|nr:hypothetical protein MmTuc01_2642 [Methanosarcina mazei Tuc01]
MFIILCLYLSFTLIDYFQLLSFSGIIFSFPLFLGAGCFISSSVKRII